VKKQSKKKIIKSHKTNPFFFFFFFSFSCCAQKNLSSTFVMIKSFGEWTDEDARAAIESIRATVPDIDSYCVRFIYVFLFDCFFVLGDKNRGV
jgi:hypothetical protein